MRRREHCAGLLLGLLLVVLGGRALAYAATPTPLAGELGGPRLPVLAFVALAAAAVLAFGVLWLAALGVRERHVLEPAPGPAPRLALARFGVDSLLLGAASLIAFAGLETWVHARAGMHMHWWQCLEGPVHRNAVPILLALSLAAGALLAALRHVLAWARRVAHVLSPVAAPARRAPAARARPAAGRGARMAARPRSAGAWAARSLRPVADTHERREHESHPDVPGARARGRARRGARASRERVRPRAPVPRRDRGGALAADATRSPERGGERLHDPDPDDGPERVRPGQRRPGRGLDRSRSAATR